MENDVAPVKLARTSNEWDLNPYFGRVTYTYGPGIDQPLGVVRLGYADWPKNKGWDDWAPFAFVPLWNSRGQPDNAYFPVGGAKHCAAGDTLRCVSLNLPAFWTVYGSYAPPVTPVAWQGTLLENKTDKTGTLYRRYRVYDPVTGRFTQEDPIGFAGGWNLYGFAAADPVNFSDPFGLCPPEDDNLYDCPDRGQMSFWQRTWTPIRYVEEEGKRYPVSAGSFPDWMGPGGVAKLACSAATLSRHSTRFTNAVKALDDRHLSAAARELAGEASRWDHVNDVREAQNAMRTIIRSMNGYLKNPNLTNEMRAGAEQLLRNAQEALQRAEGVVPR